MGTWVIILLPQHRNHIMTIIVEGSAVITVILVFLSTHYKDMLNFEIFSIHSASGSTWQTSIIVDKLLVQSFKYLIHVFNIQCLSLFYHKCHGHSMGVVPITECMSHHKPQWNDDIGIQTDLCYTIM